MNKVVSLFGSLEVWHRPRVNKVCVLVKALIKLDCLVPYSVVMTPKAQFLGAATKSWSILVYFLNGRTSNIAQVSNEEPAPPLNATPHPYEFPYLNVAQEHELNAQIWLQQNVDIRWEEAAAPHVQNVQVGWGHWCGDPGLAVRSTLVPTTSAIP